MTGPGKPTGAGKPQRLGRLVHLAVAAVILAGLAYGWRARKPSVPPAPSATETTAPQTTAATDKPGASTSAAAGNTDASKPNRPPQTSPEQTSPEQTSGTGARPASGAASTKDAKSDDGHKPASVSGGTPEPGAPESNRPETGRSGPDKRDTGALFRDNRALADGKPVAAEAGKPPSADTAGADETLSERQSHAGPGSIFRDGRPLADATAPPPPSFQDSRPLVQQDAPGKQPGGGATGKGGLFDDSRALVAPSFRDERPMLANGGPAPSAGPDPAQGTPRQSPAAATASGPGAPAATQTAARIGVQFGAQIGSPATPPQPVAPSSPGSPASPGPEAPGPGPGKPPSQRTALPTIVAVNAPPIRVDAGACAPPELSSEPLDGGRMRILVNASCRPGEAVQLSYGGAELIRKFDAFGRLDMILDCFAGADGGVLLRFADGSQNTLAIATRDLDKVSKIAVVWHAPVNLDLHVFEYAARYDQPGHIWARSGSTFAAARAQILGDKRGHGFLSTADDAASLGDKVEVYTFLHSDEQTSGAISLALDYETRGEMPTGANCGQGALAEIDFQVVMLPRGGRPTRQPGVLTRVECGRHIAREARLNQSALPGLRIRR